MLRDVPKQERELAEMSRPLAIKNSIYSFLLQKREEAALSFGATVADSRLVDRASSTAIPVSPKKPFVLLLSLFGAFAVGVIYLLLKEVFNSKILFRSDIEAYTTIPILGEVVYDNTKGPLIISGAGRTFGEEQFRQIRASINYVNNRGTSKKIMVTSSIAGEGKSFIASNLALSIAMSGKKVVLVDMDLYLPKVAGIFGFENDNKGVANYLTGAAEADSIIKKSAVSDNLFIITAGKSDNDVSELIVNGKGQGLINYLETIFDTVVIDSTPVLALTDAYTISSWCDATLYVVRHRVTPKIHIQRLDENAEMHRLKNTGIVFNGVRKRGTGKYGYGYGYGYDYDYGYQYKEGPKKKRKVNA
jgi:tyrosine-protein kinase Etk/Wzc